jgi:hypothetical protein
MNAPLTLKNPSHAGLSAFDLLLFIAVVSMIAGFLVFSLVRGNSSTYRTTTAVEIAGYLQKARSDSMRRNATDLNQMSQVKIFNRRFYSIAIDSDSDGNLDVRYNSDAIRKAFDSAGVFVAGIHEY